MPLYVGTEVHQEIANYYEEANYPDQPIYANYISVELILSTGYGIKNPPLTSTELQSKPDIVNVPKESIYEIRAVVESYGNAVSDLTFYLNAFHKAGVTQLQPGPSDAVGTAGIVPAPGGYAVFASPAPGVILYRWFRRGNFAPRSGDQCNLGRGCHLMADTAQRSDVRGAQVLITQNAQGMIGQGAQAVVTAKVHSQA